ncbi:MAG TPA: FecR domain-containing protein, partial [Vicinamibacterales bacterium]|nr:FecR domain-containing protein [Vicinamibacterales bacterium]
MPDDRLEQALQEMTAEPVDVGRLDAARARVWKTLGCAEFQQDFSAYLAGELSESRRMLVQDHLSRCSACRARIAGMKGERTVVAMPVRSTSASRWIRRGWLAAAAALFLSIVYLGLDSIDAWLAPGGPRATVVSAHGGVYRLAEETSVEAGLAANAAVGEHETVRTGPGAHVVLRLADGSTVDVNQRTELYVTAAWSGQSIHLQRGDIIVQAAKQRRGHLRVLTHDSIASVKGTVFAVSAGMGGSVVSVVEGSVAVNQPGKQYLLKPGQQAASMPALASSVADAVAWSPDARQYLELLASFANIDKGLAAFPSPMRTNATLLSQLPAGAVVYGTVPNPGITIDRAMALAEEQSATNATFNAWWNSETGQKLKDMVSRIQSLNPLLGEEIVFCVSVVPGEKDHGPFVMAKVQPGKRAELASALAAVVAATGESGAPPYSVSDDLMIVSSSAEQLSWALSHLGQGAASPFAQVLAQQYQRGVGWLMGIDAQTIVASAGEGDAPPVKLAGMVGMKYIFVEQRAPAGAEENEVTLAFQGQRTGLGSWLADAGSGGAAEYLPADALAAGYLSTREPLELFQELGAQITKSEPNAFFHTPAPGSFDRGMSSLDDKLGPGFVENLTAAWGTETAVALTGFSTTGPAWIMTSLANNPPVIDSSLKKLVDAFNAELTPENQARRIAFEQETTNGRTWTTVRPGGSPFS